MPTSSRTTAGLALFALLALVDIAWPVLAWAGAVEGADAPPTGVLLVFALLGLVTLATLQPARLGNRAAARVMTGTRVVSALLADLPALLLGAPAWIKAVTAVAIALTALGIWWTAPLLRSAPTSRVTA